jgi:Crp-like helix-turn-helix domain
MMTSGLITQGSDLFPTFRARCEIPSTPRVGPAVARRRLLAAAQSHVRVAALLSSISRNNRYEGRDPAFIPDCFSSGFVADLLGLSVDDLADALIELKHRGLVQEQGSALRLTDLSALERLIESDCPLAPDDCPAAGACVH